jgi:hypothetical protein
MFLPTHVCSILSQQLKLPVINQNKSLQSFLVFNHLKLRKQRKPGVWSREIPLAERDSEEAEYGRKERYEKAEGTIREMECSPGPAAGVHRLNSIHRPTNKKNDISLIIVGPDEQ